MNRYSMLVQWSDEDELFLVTIPEFSERVVMPCTHGKTREEAISNGEEVIEMYLEAMSCRRRTYPRTFYTSASLTSNKSSLFLVL